MNNKEMILAEGQYYSMDCYETKLNNNVLVVGTSGSGKTRSIVTPNILKAEGSYIVSDPKGNLYGKYKDYLEEQGYSVMKLDFTDPANSEHYNFFSYIENNQDIIRISHMIAEERNSYDPFWDDATQLLLQSLIAYLVETRPRYERNLSNLLRLVTACYCEYDNTECTKSKMDCLMEALQMDNPDSFAYKSYQKFRTSADKTLRSILISLCSKIGCYDSEEIEKMTQYDTLCIKSIGRRKTALFVVISDTDRSMDTLANIFFTQAMSELCSYADRECDNNCLPVPVRFILDDFATNLKIDEFPRMISSIRSRNISAMIMIQAESQLAAGYGADAKTIIGNCDTYVYLGGNDVETASAVARRCDLPLRKILYMPVGTNWIFRRGQEPVNGTNFNIENMPAYKQISRHEETIK